MNDIKIFESSIFGQIRTLGTSDNPLFCAVDVCNALGYSNGRDAISRHVDREDVVKCDCLTNRGIQSMSFVNESGLYALIFGSKQERAKEFKSWVMREVLPSIRKTGSYSVNNTFKDRVEGAMVWVRGISDLLRLNDTSKLALVKQVAEPLGLPTPSYIQSKGVLKSAKELLKTYDCGISSIAFNKLAVKAGLLEDKTRNSSHGEIKHFKSITEKGSAYGENQINPNNPKETQPLWHEDKFGEVIKIIGL